MNSSPILIVPGEKKSIFFEIFFKSLKSKFFTSPLILICDKKILNKEIRKYKSNIYIEQIKIEDIFSKRFCKKEIYLVHVENKNSNKYIHNCFKVAFELIKKGLTKK